ncbi:MAG: carboxypeptidase regulatory-like domain-containing protein, partial [Planctomycetes bacterium]|nr:carboxypeptidase regulatory-like domain-containing protein [Planctomycetota bacterium]
MKHQRAVFLLVLAVVGLASWFVVREFSPPGSSGGLGDGPGSPRELLEARRNLDTILPPLDAETAPTDLIAAPTLATIRGVVVGHDDAVVSGATLILRPGWDSPLSPVEMVTGEFGRFAFTRLLPTGRYDLFVFAPGHPAEVRRALRPSPDAVVVQLNAGLTIHGRIHDLEDRGIAYARVEFHALLAGMIIRSATVSDETGKYELTGIPGEANRCDRPYLEVQARGHCRRVVDLVDLVPRTSPPPFRFRRDIALSAGATLRVQVVDALTRGPVAGAQVEIYDLNRDWGEIDVDDPRLPPAPTREPVEHAQTNDEGWVQFDHCPVSECGLFLRHPEFPTNWPTLEVRAAAEGHAVSSVLRETMSRTGDVAELVMTLSRRCSLRGRVVDAEGHGVPGFPVRVEVAHWRAADRHGGQSTVWMPGDPALAWEHRPEGRAVVHLQCDDEGRFRLEGLPTRADEPTEVAVSGADLTLGFGVQWFTIPQGEDLEIPDQVVAAVTDLALVYGYVVDDQGRPVPGALVRVDLGPFEATDEQGRFRLATLGGWTSASPRPELVAKAEGFATQVLAIEAPLHREALVVRMQPEAPISGRVVDAAGQALGGGLVEAYPTGANSSPRTFSMTRSDAQGAFTLRGTGTEPYVVRAHGIHVGGGIAQRRDVVGGTRDLILQMATEQPPQGRLRLQLVDAATGGPLRAFVETYVDGAHGRTRARRESLSDWV